MTGAEPGSRVRLPPGPRLPRALRGAAFPASRRRMTRLMRRRYGRVLPMNVPLFGQAVFVSNPALVRQLFELSSTHQAPERWHSRGVAYAPANGGRAIVHRRTLRRTTVVAQGRGDAHAQVPA